MWNIQFLLLNWLIIEFSIRCKLCKLWEKTACFELFYGFHNMEHLNNAIDDYHHYLLRIFFKLLWNMHNTYDFIIKYVGTSSGKWFFCKLILLFIYLLSYFYLLFILFSKLYDGIYCIIFHIFMLAELHNLICIVNNGK